MATRGNLTQKQQQQQQQQQQHGQVVAARTSGSSSKQVAVVEQVCGVGVVEQSRAESGEHSSVCRRILDAELLTRLRCQATDGFLSTILKGVRLPGYPENINKVL